MSDSQQTYVFSAVEVMKIEMIDGGRTMAIRLVRADGGEAAVLFSLLVAQDLSGRIAEALSSNLIAIEDSKL